MIGGATYRTRSVASAREMLATRLGGRPDGERRKRNQAESESESSRNMAKKYLIETYGCQMNVHDSERMAGLLEQAGYEPTADDRDADVIVINTCSVRERAEEKLFTRLGEIRQQGARARRPSGRRGRRLRRAAGGHADPASARRRSTSIIGTQNIKRLPMLVDAGRRTLAAPAPRRSSTSIRSTTCRFRSALRGGADPLKAYVTIIEGCNEFCAFCVVPYTRGHERMRPVAEILAEARHAVGDRREGDPAARADRQPLPGARRSGVRFRRRCSSG